MKPLVVLTGGGTGGHLRSVRVLAEAFSSLGARSVFIGSDAGQDPAWFREGDLGIEAFYYLGSRTVMDRTPLGQIASLGRLAVTVPQALAILRRHRANAVLSVGAFAAAPTGFAAILGRIPLFIHEHNRVAGRLHRLLTPYSREVYNSFDERSPVKDYPISRYFFESRRARSRMSRILFLGGSRGASFINRYALSLAPELSRRGIAIAHQTGREEVGVVTARYGELEIRADVFDFDKDVSRRMAAADFAVSRAGAGTSWELAANGLPALFIPYPTAVRDHQYENARYFAERGLAFLVRQADAGPEDVLGRLEIDLAPVSRALLDLIRPGGARALAEHVLARLPAAS